MNDSTSLWCGWREARRQTFQLDKISLSCMEYNPRVSADKQDALGFFHCDSRFMSTLGLPAAASDTTAAHER